MCYKRICCDEAYIPMECKTPTLLYFNRVSLYAAGGVTPIYKDGSFQSSFSDASWKTTVTRDSNGA